MPQNDSDLYADFYGEEEDEISPTNPDPPPETGSAPSTSKTPLSAPAATPKEFATTSLAKNTANSYSSQVAQQFTAYRKQSPPPVTTTSTSPVSPTSSSGLTATSLTTPVSTYVSPMHPGASIRPSEMKDEGKMFIGGLHWDTTDDTLRDYMAQFGPVDACTIMRDPTGRSRGFAFLTFVDPESVEAAVAHKEHVLDGKVIDPKRAVPRQEYLRHQRIFVGGLPPSVTTASLRQHFAQYGEVVDCMVMLDRETNRSKGFGFVTYNDCTGVQAALAAIPIELDGRTVEVKEATPRGSQPQSRPAVKQQQTDESSQSAIPANGPAWNGGNMNMASFNPSQMAQLYSGMMMGNPNYSMGMMGMNPMGMGGMNGMGGMGMMPMMMNPMAMNRMMGSMGVMNPMMMNGGMGMAMPSVPNASSATGGMTSTQQAQRTGTTAGTMPTRTQRGGMTTGGGPSRMMNRGANNFHPYAR